MVLVIFTRAGYDDMRTLISARVGPVWVNGGVLTESEIMELCAGGLELSAFSSKSDPENQSEFDAVVSIVAEHHPDERLWVEIQSGPGPQA